MDLNTNAYIGNCVRCGKQAFVLYYDDSMYNGKCVDCYENDMKLETNTYVELTPGCYFKGELDLPWLPCIVKNSYYVLKVGNKGFKTNEEAIAYAANVIRWLNDSTFNQL